VRRGAIILAVLFACVGTGIAGASSQSLIVGRSTVTGLAADGGEVAFAAARTAADCDRVFIWQGLSRRTIQLGKKQRCDTAGTSRGTAGVAVNGGRALWVTYSGSSTREWRLWTATATKTTPRLLQVVTRPASDPQPVIVGAAGGGLLPYAVDSTVTALHTNGTPAFTWTASSTVVAVAAATNGRVAVAETGGRVTVLDAHAKVLSVDLYMSDVSAVAVTSTGLLVQRASLLEFRREADAHEFPIPAGARLADAHGKWGVWTDGKLVHLIHLPDGAQKASYPGAWAAFAGTRLYVANGRTITVRTIR
jgi:hypothetical protein